MQIARLGLIVLVLGVLSYEVAAAETPPQYPQRPVRIIVGFPPGSQPDTVARLFADRFAESWRQPVIVENIPGVAGNIAADRVAKAAPDGYTLGLIGQGPLVINAALYKLDFDPTRDFAPISQVYSSSTMLVVPAHFAAKNLKELVAMAKAAPGALTYASGGAGGASHMAAELFKVTAGLDITHIPYKGTVAAIPDLLAGRVTMMLSPTADVLSLVRDGKLRALAVTSSTRIAAAPDVPTLAESGYPGFEFAVWQGLMAPAKTPQAIVEKVHQATLAALKRPDLRARLEALGLEALGGSPEQLARIIRAETPKWAALAKRAGIRPE